MGSSVDSDTGAESDEGPQHEVNIQPFALSRTEITMADYMRFVDAENYRSEANLTNQCFGNSLRSPDYMRSSLEPVTCVTWKDANAYALWLTQQTGHDYRLPTEAEWEYAARAGTTTPFWTGTCIRLDQANYKVENEGTGCGMEAGNSPMKPVAAGSLPANAWGLHEIAGNVWEWTEDCWHDNYAGAPTDGKAWKASGGGDCNRRVLRGGSWGDSAQLLRSAYRYSFPVKLAVGYVGIRLARTP